MVCTQVLHTGSSQVLNLGKIYTGKNRAKMLIHSYIHRRNNNKKRCQNNILVQIYAKQFLFILQISVSSIDSLGFLIFYIFALGAWGENS